MNFTMTIERALTDTLGLETAFVGTRGVKFINGRDYNLPDRVTGRVPNPAILSDRYYDNSDSTHYYAWQSTLRRRFSRGLVANLHYTWSKAIAYSRGDIGFGNTIIQDFFDIRSNKGRAESDVTHNFVADFVYRVSIPRAWSCVRRDRCSRAGKSPESCPRALECRSISPSRTLSPGNGRT